MSRNAPYTQPNSRRPGHRLRLALWCVTFAWLPSTGLPAETFTTSLAPTGPRVVIVEDRAATEAFQPRPEVVEAMVRRGLTNLTEQTTPRAAWLSLVSLNDTVGLKVYSRPGPNSGTRPAVVAAVAQSLIAAGMPSQQIIIWDKEEADLREAGFMTLAAQLGVRVAASTKTGFNPTNFYDTPLIGNLVFGDLEFEKKGDGIGRKSFVAKLVTSEMTKIINITPLLNSNEAGVCGNLYGLALGSVDNSLRFENDPGRLAQAVPEIYALPILGDRVVLNITDALICQYEGGPRGLLHYSAVLDQLRFSRDPVALDVLSIKELTHQRGSMHGPNLKPNMELYRNAALLELGVSDVSRIQVETLR
ncbi:MAG: DUF362 domain-containing protein [Verrucomicrobia subdivision 3 bacterium]|nr:DUF362 domain-containing protein [Verrucomicrobiota bacterium]MCC6820899.1 DUF362 domain-containing protein [Limisphaerales bacterium]